MGQEIAFQLRMNRTLALLTFFIGFSIVGLGHAKAQAVACVDVFRLSNRLTFVRARNAEINSDLKQSPNREGIKAKVLTSMSAPRFFVSKMLRDSGVQLRIVQSGFGKPIEVQIVGDNKTEVIFSNTQLSRNGSFAYFDSSFSSDQKILVVAFAKNGSIDEFHLVVLDLQTKKLIAEIQNSTSSDVVWIAPTEFLFKALSPDLKASIHRFNVGAQSVTTEPNSGFLKGPDHWSARWTGQSWSLISKSGETISTPLTELSSILSVTNKEAILEVQGPKKLGQIIKIQRIGDTTLPAVVVRGEDHLLTSAEVQQGYLIANVRWGAARAVQIHDLDGQQLAEITVPDCCSIGSMKWSVVGEKLSVSLYSALSGSKPFVYDLKTKSWDRTDFTEQLMTVDGIKYATSIEQVPASDGTLIPMRLTHRADLKQDGSNPVLFKQYGGFNRTGSIDPSSDNLIAMFIKHGGILAAPALRGGNEYGPDWHKQGMLENKKTTMNDLIDTARWMTRSKWTRPDRIIITGGSNGGLTVASAALQAPDAFGLIIPIAGVHDLLNKEVLDPNFGPGWKYEYGDSREAAPRAGLELISPVELAKLKSMPNFLIITGRNDSRVNAEHSYRLTEALLSNPQKNSEVRMVGIANSGHWLTSAARQNNQIALRANVIMWTKIYDYLGWKI